MALRGLASRPPRVTPHLAGVAFDPWPAPLALGHEPDDGTALARFNGGRVRFANKQAVRTREQHEHGTVLRWRRRRDRDAIGTGRQRGAQVVGALVVCREITAEARR